MKIKKINKKIIKNIYVIFTLSGIILYLYAFSINNNENEIFLMNIFGILIDKQDLLFIFAPFAFILFILMINKSWEKFDSFIKILSIFLMILLIFVYSIFSFFYINNKLKEKHYEFTSPSKKHSIIISETSSLVSSSVEFYIRQNPFVISRQPILFPIFHDLTPIKQNQYRQKWKENTFIFEGKNFFHNDGRWKKIEIHLENKDIDIKEYTIDSNGNIIPEKIQNNRNETDKIDK